VPVNDSLNPKDAKIQYELGLKYERGNEIPQDFQKAAEWYREAAEQGNSSAQYNLAGLYRDGKGVEQNDAMAVACYSAAAEQWNAEAQHELGMMYANGRGVSSDIALRATRVIFKAPDWLNVLSTDPENPLSSVVGQLLELKATNKEIAYFYLYLAYLNGYEKAREEFEKLEHKGFWSFITPGWGKLSSEEVTRAKEQAIHFYELHKP
jgi:TPR repeat protein